MKMKTQSKLAIAKRALALYAEKFSVLKMSEHAAGLNCELRPQALAASVSALTSHDQPKA
jgi:hypothetical protein